MEPKPQVSMEDLINEERTGAQSVLQKQTGQNKMMSSLVARQKSCMLDELDKFEVPEGYNPAAIAKARENRVTINQIVEMVKFYCLVAPG